MIKESTHQEDITVIDMYKSNVKQLNKWSKLAKLKEELDSNTIIETDFSTPLDIGYPPMDIPHR